MTTTLTADDAGVLKAALATILALSREPLAKLLGLAAWRSPQFSW